MCDKVAAALLTVADPQAKGKCINQFNCPEIQCNEHLKVSYYWLTVACLVTIYIFLKFLGREMFPYV